jgi:hypothetical protein
LAKLTETQILLSSLVVVHRDCFENLQWSIWSKFVALCWRLGYVPSLATRYQLFKVVQEPWFIDKSSSCLRNWEAMEQSFQPVIKSFQSLRHQSCSIWRTEATWLYQTLFSMEEIASVQKRLLPKAIDFANKL